MFDQCEEISGSVVSWLGDQVAAAADEVFLALIIPAASATRGGGRAVSSGRGGQPDIQLFFLIARHGVPELLRVLSGFMETRGDLSSTIVRECGAIELWREGQQGPTPGQ